MPAFFAAVVPGAGKLARLVKQTGGLGVAMRAGANEHGDHLARRWRVLWWSPVLVETANQERLEVYRTGLPLVGLSRRVSAAAGRVAEKVVG